MMHRTYCRFLILTSPRCGTHMLRTSFAEHPSVIAHTELFNPDWNVNEPFDDSMSAARILDEHVFRRYPPAIGAVGFALHRSGARFGNWPELLDLLEADTELAVISLRRNDLLRRYLSFCLMRERNRSGLGDRFQPTARSYRRDDLQAEFERAEAELAEFDERFAAHPLLPVSYEQLVDDYAPTLRRIHVFLGARPEPVRPTTPRNASPALDQLITNYAELAEAFAGTRWAWYFRTSPHPQSMKFRYSGSLD